MCFDFLFNICLKHFPFSEELSEIWSKMFMRLHVKYPLFLSDFYENWIFSRDFRKIWILNFMKIRPVDQSCSMRTDGRTDRQTDMTKPIVAFRNVANATKTYVIGVFSSGIFFIPRFIILDQLVQKLRLMDKRITYIETTWRSECQLSKAGKVMDEDAASRCPLRLGLL